MVDAILLALSQNTLPRRLIGRREACLRKTAVAHRSTQPYRSAIHQQLRTFCRHASHAKGGTQRVTVYDSIERMQVGVELIPQRCALQRDNNNTVSGYQRLTIIDPKFHLATALFPHSNTYLHLVNIRVDTQLTDVAHRMCLQCDTTHDAIPITLCLVCY